MTEQIDRLLTIKEVCELLGCHPQTVRRWEVNGTLVGIRVGKRRDRRFRKSDIDTFILKGNQ